MKLLVINNLSSGFGKSAVYDFMRMFSEAGDEVVVRSIDSSMDFASALTGAEFFDAVAVAGGDGTHSSVCYLLRDTGIPILPLPVGTANLIAMNLCTPEEPYELAQLARNGKRLRFDMGQLEFADATSGFMMIAGCGYDAKIMSDAKGSKQLLGPVSYFKAAFDNPNPQRAHFTIDIDGETVEADGVCVLVLNFSKMQFDITLGPGNWPRDGLLDLLILEAENAWGLLPVALSAALDHTGGMLLNIDTIKHFRGKAIRVDADPALFVQYDGEPTTRTTPFTARVLPHAANLVISDYGYEEFGNQQMGS